MDAEKVEGIVLKQIPFKETDRIVSLLTPDRGLLSLYVKGGSKQSPFLINLTSPLCRGDFVFRKGCSDLYRFIDGAILDLHLPIRSSFLSLQCGAKMLEALLKTQAPGKSAHRLYSLFIAYLKHLSKAIHPETLWASFVLKLLKYEGVLSIEPLCLLCKKEKASCIRSGESRCSRCADTTSLLFSKSEWNDLILLIEARRFGPLLTVALPPHFIQTVDALFHALFYEK